MRVAATSSTTALRRLPRVSVSLRIWWALTVVLRSSQRTTSIPVFARSWSAKASAFCAAARYAYHTYGLTPVFVAVEKHQDPGANQLAAAGLDIPHYFLSDAGSAGTIIGVFSRMQVVVSMRLHALIFAAGQGIPLVGVVYDPKVSAFLRYIGQNLFADLSMLNTDTLQCLIDQAAAQAGHPEKQEQAVQHLQEIERQNVTVARRLLES